MEAFAQARHFHITMMRLIMIVWAHLTARAKKSEIEEIMQHQSEILGKRANSIWLMRKAELVEVALQEVPKATRSQLESLRVDELQYVIQFTRDRIKKEQGPTMENKIPGLTRLKHGELITKAHEMGIPTEDPERRYGLKTRVQLIDEIKEMLMSNAPPETILIPDDDMDFDLVEEPAFPDAAKAHFEQSTASSPPPASRPTATASTTANKKSVTNPRLDNKIVRELLLPKGPR